MTPFELARITSYETDAGFNAGLTCAPQSRVHKLCQGQGKVCAT